MKIITRISFFVICLLFINLLTVNFAEAVGSPTPTIDYIKNTVIGINDTILVSGVAASNSEVLVYIDQTFIGLAKITSDENNSLNFYQYSLKSELVVGEHKVMIIGRDKTSMVLSPPTAEFSFKFQLLPTPPAPTIIFPSGKSIFSNIRPIITGLTKSGTNVSLIIDGVLTKQIKVFENNSGTDNFSYQPTKDLSSGTHILTAIATDKYNQNSTTSKPVEFKIEKPLPAPVLLRVISLKDLSRPYISGLAKNDLTINVFVDNKINGSFTVKNHKSGTANFSYQVSRPLTKGQHWVYTTSIDKHGKVSGRSNIIKINIGKEDNNILNEIKPVVTPKAVEKEFTTEPNKQTPVSGETNNTSQVEEENKEQPTEKALESSDLKDIIKNATTTKASNTGIIDESNTQQSKIKLNLVVFILFLLAVIAWIFWVNRELIKEKNSQGKIPAEPEKDKDTENKI
jgi:cbb3-type cytochrome oxidase subunit 3